MENVQTHPVWRSSSPALVLGAAGFVGRHLTAALRLSGATVSTIECNPHDAWSLSTLVGSIARTIHVVRPAAIFNLIGSGTPQGRAGDSNYHIRKNVHSALAVAAGLRDAQFEGRLVFISTGGVYGNTPVPATEDTAPNPVTAAAEAKLVAESVMRDAIPHVTVARPFQIFGEGQRKLVVYDLTRRVLYETGPLYLNSKGDEQRDFVYVGEVVTALRFLADRGGDCGQGGTFNVASGLSTPIAALANRLLTLAGQADREVISAPGALANSLSSSVGDPAKLSGLGYQVAAMSAMQLRRTIRWVALHEP